jgi:glycosyltransferase involved in cell wall biosynthesis
VAEVTVIMPIRNEEDAIGDALESVLTQDIRPDRVEVLVVDGRSTDRTRDVVEAIAAADPRVRLLDNPAETVPTALNLGLAEATGEVIVRVDGHCVLPGDYLTRCLDLLDETGADCVGGMIATRGTTPVARAIATAQSSPFGVGGAAFRTGRAVPGAVDTLAFGAYRREVFDRLGGFDEDLVRNQDDEFNLRITEGGGVIWLDPALVTTYTSRATLAGLWRQYFEYGLYKVRVAQKHRRVPSWRHGVPLAFVLALLVTAVRSVVRRDPRPLAAVLIPYLVATGVASVSAARGDPDVLPLLPPAYATLHLAYGTGTLAGLWRFRHHFPD